MDRRTFLKTIPTLAVLAGSPGFAKDLEPITLLKPQTDGGKSVLEAIKERRTNRNISDKRLSPQTLSKRRFDGATAHAFSSRGKAARERQASLASSAGGACTKTSVVA